MKKFLINFKEVSYGVVEVFAETEEEAREIAETDGMRYEDNSELVLGELVSKEDIDDNEKQNNKHYYKIDVSGRNGYSFMVCCDWQLDEGQVLDKAWAKGLFDDDNDVNYAVVDDLVSDYDIENFKDCTYEID